MLLDFTVGNFRSFSKQMTLSLHAQKIKEEPETNVVGLLSYQILKTLAVYGANSSGKSNLINAMNAMKSCVLSSVKLNDNDTLPFEPFVLTNKIPFEPTLFEITFIKENVCYRYGFKQNETSITEEWLFQRTTPRSKEYPLFIRTPKGLALDDKRFPEGENMEKRLNANRLFLSLCAQLGGSTSNRILSWFQKDFNIVSGLANQNYRAFSTMQLHERTAIGKEALKFFKKLQLGFEDLHTKEITPDSNDPNLPKEIRQLLAKRKVIELTSIHKCYNKKGDACGDAKLPFDNSESSGTKKLFDLSGPLFDTLSNGGVLVIDELDAKMHPLISQHIIRLFNNSETNPKNAQLIFTTHDTHLLSQNLLRRDQIWFTEKDQCEQTDLYCLMDIVLPDGSKPRNDANYEKNYIAGRYGAIPYIIND